MKRASTALRVHVSAFNAHLANSLLISSKGFIALIARLVLGAALHRAVALRAQQAQEVTSQQVRVRPALQERLW